MHQRAEVSAHVAAARERSRLANHRLIATNLRSLGIAEKDLDDAVVIVVSFGDGVLLRNVSDTQLKRLCRILVERLTAKEKSDPARPRIRGIRHRMR